MPVTSEENLCEPGVQELCARGPRAHCVDVDDKGAGPARLPSACGQKHWRLSLSSLPPTPAPCHQSGHCAGSGKGRAGGAQEFWTQTTPSLTSSLTFSESHLHICTVRVSALPTCRLRGGAVRTACSVARKGPGVELSRARGQEMVTILLLVEGNKNSTSSP